MQALRILVADDETIIRVHLREMLTQMGHKVVGEACSGADVIAKSRKLDPDLVFLDIKMPGMDGLEALERMNEEKLRPVIILTAFSDRGFVERAVELGASAYIVKPFEPSHILPAMRVATAHFEELQSLRAENASLKEAVEAGKLVARAKSLLMEHEGLSDRDAFRWIQKASMDKNKKMKEVAEAVILVYAER